MNSAIAEMAAQSCTVRPHLLSNVGPHFNAPFLSNLWEYHHISYSTYTAKNEILWATFLTQTVLV